MIAVARGDEYEVEGGVIMVCIPVSGCVSTLCNGLMKLLTGRRPGSMEGATVLCSWTVTDGPDRAKPGQHRASFTLNGSQSFCSAQG